MKPTPELLAALTPAERAELDALLRVPGPQWLPTVGPQLVALRSEADITGFGGSAGGGKSDLACGLAATEHQRSIIFRTNGTELLAIRQRLAEILGPSADWNGRDNLFTFQRGGKTCTIELGAFPDVGDERKYQGREHDFIAFDEAANMREAQVRFLFGWLRSKAPGQRKRIVLGFNPPMTVEGRWIVAFFAPWLDEKHPRPARPGELRWFVTIKQADVEVPDARPFVISPEGERVYTFDASRYAPEDIYRPMSRTFLPSRVSANPFLANTGYVSVLQSLPGDLGRMLLHGDFGLSMRDDPWQVIPTAWVDRAMERWSPRMPLPEMESIGVDVAMGGDDEHVIVARHVGQYYGEPIAHPGADVPDGPRSAALVVAAWRDHAVVHVDAFGVGAKTYGALAATGIQTVGVLFGDKVESRDASGVMRFANLRSLLWWRMRELLDPNANNGIALPPHKRLRADLCAPKYEGRGSGDLVYVQSREDVLKKLGRSPDYGTACILAAVDTPKLRRIAALDRVAGRRSAQEYDPFRDL